MRKYLQEAEAEIVQAEKNYISELERLQAACEHKIILEFVNSDYRYLRVCEDCGLSAAKQWSSPGGALGGRAYSVGRTEYYAATPFREPKE